MVSGTSASLCWILLFTVSVSEGSSNVTAEPGRTVTLPCQAPRNTTVQVVEWIRRDLDNPTVCVYRDGKWENSDPSFKDRVQLNNHWEKNGNVSLILKNVTINDTGKYECHVRQRESKRRKRDVHLDDGDLIKPIVYLTVGNSGGGAKPKENSGDKNSGDKNSGDKNSGDKNGGGPGLGIGLGVVVLFVIGGVVVFALKRKGFIKVNSYNHPLQSDQQQI